MPWNLSHFLRYVVEICENNLAILSFNSVLNISFEYYLSKTCIVQTPNVGGKMFQEKKIQNKSSNFMKEKEKYKKKNGINLTNQFKFLFFLIVQFWPSNRISVLYTIFFLTFVIMNPLFPWKDKLSIFKKTFR